MSKIIIKGLRDRIKALEKELDTYKKLKEFEEWKETFLIKNKNYGNNTLDNQDYLE